MLAWRNKTAEKIPEAFILWESQRKSRIWRRQKISTVDRVCVAYVVDKYPHAELATLIPVYMFLHQNANSSYSIY